MNVHFHGSHPSPLYGTTDDKATYNSISFAYGERITSLRIGQVHNTGARVGFIDLTTSNGQRFRHGSDGAERVVSINVYSGFNGGIRVRHGHDIDMMSFFMFEEIAFGTIDLTYVAVPDAGSISAVSFEQIEGDNRGSEVPLQLAIAKEKVVAMLATTEESWAQSLGVGFEVSMGFLGIGESTAGPEFKVAHQKTNSTSYSETSTLSWTGNVTVPPGERYVIDLVYFEGSFSFEYEANISLTAKDGSVWRPAAKNGRVVGNSSGGAKLMPRKLGKDVDDGPLEWPPKPRPYPWTR